jgi:hypothetical protein
MGEMTDEQTAEILILAAVDMGMTRAAAVALFNDTSTDHYYRRALETAIAVSYWRPFSKNNKIGCLTDEYAPDRPDWRGFHDWFEKARNKRYAHTDREGGRSAEIRIVGTDESGNMLAEWREEWEILPVDWLPNVVAMCEAQARRFLFQADSLGLKLEHPPVDQRVVDFGL